MMEEGIFIESERWCHHPHPLSELQQVHARGDAQTIQRYFLNRPITPLRLAQLSAAQHSKVESALTHPKLKQIYKDKSHRCKRLTRTQQPPLDLDVKSSSRTLDCPEEEQ